VEPRTGPEAEWGELPSLPLSEIDPRSRSS